MTRHRRVAGAVPLLAALLLAALPLAGCRTDPGPPPILSLERNDCTTRPETARAAPLPLEKRSDSKDGAGMTADEPLTLAIDRSSPCLDLGDAGRSLYGIVALPRLEERYIVRVAAQPGEAGIFSPHLVLLDEAGARLREIDRDLGSRKSGYVRRPARESGQHDGRRPARRLVLPGRRQRAERRPDILLRRAGDAAGDAPGACGGSVGSSGYNRAGDSWPVALRRPGSQLHAGARAARVFGRQPGVLSTRRGPWRRPRAITSTG
jgi:hypothetical protein